MKRATKTIIAKAICISIVFALLALIAVSISSHPNGELLIYPLGAIAGLACHRISIS